MNTKREEILAVALNLFNKKDIDNVTTREIAKELNMSLGNLTYYFPTKKDIILALTQEITKAVDEALSKDSAKEAPNLLVQYFKQVEIIFTTHLKFKFIVHKRYGEIISSFPEVQKVAQDFLKIRFDAWEQLNQQLVKEKFAKQELVQDSHAHSHILNVLALYWHQEFLIYYPNLTDKQKIQQALSIFFQSYKPYLTKKGLEELTPLLKKLNHY